MAGPLVAIVGETGSGKTALALELAQRFNGEIIAADSRTVYRGLDIGTAKPTAAEQTLVPHHLIDVVNPTEKFTAADFQRLADAAIDDIMARGKLPLLVGGTGLYVDAVLYDYAFRPPADPAVRARYEHLSVAELHAEIIKQKLPMPENSLNQRHLTRLLETGELKANKQALRPNTVVLGLQTDRAELDERLRLRVEAMVAAGLVKEARFLFETYGADVPALETPGYRAMRQYVAGTIGLDEAKALFVRSDQYLAKRQRTWFKRNKSIHWLPPENRLAESVRLITTELYAEPSAT